MVMRRLIDERATESMKATIKPIKRAFAEEAARLHDRSGLSTQQIARGTGAAPSTVRGWLGHRSEPRGVRAERVAELAAITERLERVMPREYVSVWLSKPIEALDFRKPLDLLAEGEYRRVGKIVASIEDPGAT
jgi:hypothetical protein